MKKWFRKAAAFVLSAAMMSASVPVVSELIGVTASAAEDKWDSFYNYKKCSTVTVDTSTYYGDSGYSIKITNSDYNVASVEKKFAVKKNTHYRASVMVKYSGYSLASNAEMEKCGATFGQVWTYNLTDSYNGSDWEKLTFEFDSGNENSYTLALYNGLWNSNCKGTAWFSDFRLEERVGEPSNRWNVLAVVFKNVKAPVEMNGKKYTYEGHLNDDDVKTATKVLDNLYTSVPMLSEDLWGFNCIDVVSTDAVVDELVTYKYEGATHGYRIECYSDSVSRELDKFMEKAEKESGKKYDQIIAIAPLTEVADWSGLGAMNYKSTNFCQVTCTSGEDWYKSGLNFRECIFVHEMLHSVERVSRDELKSPTTSLDKGPAIYKEQAGKDVYVRLGQNGWDDWGTFYSDYMRCKTPDKIGVDKRAFDTYRNCEYKVIYGSATSYPKTDVSKLTISKPKNTVYTGKAITPELTVKDGAKTLVKGTDYTLSYVNNTEIGYAAVIVKGKGKYSGKYAQNFEILPAKTKLTVTKKSGKYTFSWNKVSGAEKYEIYKSEDNGKTYKLLKTVDGAKTSVAFKLEAGVNYRFKIRACTEIYPQKFYSSYSTAVYAKSAKISFKSNKLYVIDSKCSALSLDIYMKSPDDGANLLQYQYYGGTNQQWYLEKLSNGYYLIKSCSSGKVLTVENNSTKNGGNVSQWSYQGSKFQQWSIKYVNGYYKIINRGSGMALEVDGASTKYSANVGQGKYTGKDNQLWLIWAV